MSNGISQESQFTPPLGRRNESTGFRPLESIERRALVDEFNLIKCAKDPLHQKVIEPGEP